MTTATAEKPITKRIDTIAEILPSGSTARIAVDESLGAGALALQAVVSVAAGLPFLDLYETRPGSVLFIDAEVTIGTLREQLRQVSAAVGVDGDRMGGGISLLSLKTATPAEQQAIAPERYSLVVMRSRSKLANVFDVSFLSGGPGGRESTCWTFRAGPDDETAIFSPAASRRADTISPLLLQWQHPLWLPYR